MSGWKQTEVTFALKRGHHPRRGVDEIARGGKAFAIDAAPFFHELGKFEKVDFADRRALPFELGELGPHAREPRGERSELRTGLFVNRFDARELLGRKFEIRFYPGELSIQILVSDAGMLDGEPTEISGRTAHEAQGEDEQCAFHGVADEEIGVFEAIDSLTSGSISFK